VSRIADGAGETGPVAEALSEIGRPSARRWWLLPLVVFGVGLALTAGAVGFLVNEANTHRVEDFKGRAAAVAGALEARVGMDAEVLFAVRSLFAISDTIDRRDFGAFVEVAGVAHRLPAIEVLEFVRLVSHEDRAVFEEGVRLDASLNGVGYPGFTIYPEGTRGEYWVVDYVDALAGTSAEFGLDLGSNLEGLTAIERARDTGALVASPLVGPLEEVYPPGFLLLLAIYNTEAPSSVEERRDSVVGVLIATLHTDALLEEALGYVPEEEFEIYDSEATGVSGGTSGLVFDSDERATGLTSGLVGPSTLNIGGLTWGVVVTDMTGSVPVMGGWLTWFVMGGGIVLSGTLALLQTSMVRSRARVTDLALRMTTEVRRRSAELAQTNQELRVAGHRLRVTGKRLLASNQELEEFASVAAHDLQEPLRKIQAFGDRLAAGAGKQLGERERDYLSRMTDAATRMRALVEGLLNYSRVTRRGNPFEPVGLNETVASALSDLEVVTASTGSRVERGDLPTIQGDSEQLRRLMVNLIGNALKYRHPDRSPTIRISGTQLDGDSDEAGRRYEITVEDNGIGFEPEYADRIFGVFQRLHGRAEYEGTGIGLAICRRIVERHGGEISAEGRPGEGATFTIRLPMDHTAEQEMGTTSLAS
jgi:signal transduction histidine kinase